ncbi:TPA: GNAT family N-acetyltransferase [Pseudomonas aeruginosa]|uniref:GNAT family N-acetyltransferase n=1 Tax=Pseudomonas sp. S5D5 TaxID=2083056 RepID=UPI000D0F4F30
MLMGIGRKLMSAAREWATVRGAEDLELAVWTFNTAAIRMYEGVWHGSSSV